MEQSARAGRRLGSLAKSRIAGGVKADAGNLTGLRLERSEAVEQLEPFELSPFLSDLEL